MSTMILAESTADYLGSRWSRLRTHKRILATVNMVVEWEEGKKRQAIPAFTLDVSYSACLAVVPADLKLAQNVRLINQRSGSAAEARVVWHDAGSWTVGLELLKPDASFWNL
jgi:hypothetical protein